MGVRATTSGITFTIAASNLRGDAGAGENYFELTFNAVAGVGYRLWMRGRADSLVEQNAHMALQVVAEPMDRFLDWIQRQRQPAQEPALEEQRRGRDVFMRSSCVLCHTIRGTDAGSRVGPDLTHVGSRLMVAAGTLPNTRGHLAGWVIDPQSIKPGNRMPKNGLAPDELQVVLSYLRSLR